MDRQRSRILPRDAGVVTLRQFRRVEGKVFINPWNTSSHSRHECERRTKIAAYSYAVAKISFYAFIGSTIYRALESAG